MPVDPQIAEWLAMLAAVGQPPVQEGTPTDARDGFRTLVVDGRQPEHVVPVGSVSERTIPGPAGPLDARVYRPAGDGPAPTVVLVHGGGWVIGDLDTHDNTARAICRDCAAVVVSVAYRLAPEAPFPAAVEDAVAATEWAAANLGSLGGDARLAVAGDSAGGNLAAVVAQQLRDSLAAQLLIYPATDVPGDYPSLSENGEGYFLEAPTMAWFMDQYAPDPATHTDPRLSPMRAADLAGLPPAVVVTAEFDPLRDEGEAYAGLLAAAGVRTETRRYDGMIHGFFDLGPVSPAAEAAVDESLALFAKLLAGG